MRITSWIYVCPNKRCGVYLVRVEASFSPSDYRHATGHGPRCSTCGHALSLRETVDPNANLHEQETILVTGDSGGVDAPRLADLRWALYGWLQRGGFEPTWDAAPNATVSYRAWWYELLKHESNEAEREEH